MVVFYILLFNLSLRTSCVSGVELLLINGVFYILLFNLSLRTTFVLGVELLQLLHILGTLSMLAVGSGPI